MTPPMASRYSAKITEETVLVTPTNFNKQLPLIRERLQTCVYSAVDLEMTGIVAERNSKIDDIATRYVKMVVAATRYSIIQFGLCIFAEESDGRDGIVLRASPYSFYIFSNERFGSDIVLSPGSIQFLKENKMDFGKWINEGLSFVGADKAADMRAKEQARLSKSELPVAAGAGISTLTPTSPTDLAFFNQHIAAIRLWYADSTVTEPYSIPSMHPFLRRCFYEFIESRLRAVLVTKAAGAPTVMVLKKVSPEELEQKRRDDADRFDLSLGFRLVFEALCASCAPLVLHNGLADLMFTFRWFDSALPPDYESFRAHFGALLPRGIFDTKYISTALLSDGEGTALSDLYARSQLQEGGFVVAEGAAEQFHDAGYDAFCTGAVFASFVDRVGGLQTLYDSKAHNQMYLMESLYNHSLSLDSEPCSLRVEGRVWVLHDFPASTKTDQVTSALGLGEGYKIIWINGTSLFVVATDDALPSLETLPLPAGWHALPHAAYMARLRSPCGGANGGPWSLLRQAFDKLCTRSKRLLLGETEGGEGESAKRQRVD